MSTFRTLSRLAEGRFPAGLALVCLLHFALSLPVLVVGAEDIRMVDVFSADESLAASAVQYLLRNQTLELLHYSYGGLFYYLPLALLSLAELFTPISEQAVVLVMRSVCAGSGLLCLWATWGLTRRLFGSAAGILAALLLALGEPFLRWSAEIHPDLPQLAWLMVSLWACVILFDRPTMRWCAAASAFAGLAFGTKYSGAFLIPLIACSIWLAPGAGDVKRRVRLTLIVLPVFLTAFLLTNPYVPFRLDRFFQDVAFESVHLAVGHDVIAASAGLMWWVDLAQVMGVVSAAAGVVWVISFIAGGSLGSRLRSPEGILLIWIVGYVSFLVAGANLRAGRHLLPVLPAAVALAAGGYRQILIAVEGRFGKQASAVLLALLLVAGGPGARSLDAVEHVRTRVQKVAESSELAAGRWIGAIYPASTTVVYDAYSYVPSEFRDAYRSFGMTAPTLFHFNPRLLVVRDAMVRRFASTADTSRARMAPLAFLDRHVFYTLASKDRLPGYKRVKQFEGVDVMEWTEEASAKGAPPWPDRVMMHEQNRLMRVDIAREAVGDRLAAGGDWIGAAREYGLGAAARPGNGNLHLKRAHSLMKSGRLEEANLAYDALLNALDDPNDSGPCSSACRSPDLRDGAPRCCAQAAVAGRCRGFRHGIAPVGPNRLCCR